MAVGPEYEPVAQKIREKAINKFLDKYKKKLTERMTSSQLIWRIQQETGLKLCQIAAKLDISESAISKWQKDIRIGKERINKVYREFVCSNMISLTYSDLYLMTYSDVDIACEISDELFAVGELTHEEFLAAAEILHLNGFCDGAE